MQNRTRQVPNGVKQTTPTNCFAACAATILGVSIEDIPGVDGAEWDWDAFQSWLATIGLQAVEITFGSGGTVYPTVRPVRCIISGPSPRKEGTAHAVVGRLDGLSFFMDHDPHASDLWIDGEPTHATFFVSIGEGGKESSH